MGYFDEAWVLNVIKMFQLPSDMERDMNGRSPDVKGWGDVALQRVAYHQQLFRDNA